MPSAASARARRLAVGLQQVDAQIDRRRRVERRHLALRGLCRRPVRDRARAIPADRSPPRAASADGAGCGRRGRRTSRVSAGVQRGRAKAIAVAARRDGFGRQPSASTSAASTRLRARGVDRALAGPRDPPVERRAMAQHRIDMAGDLRPVLGADIAPAPEIVGRGVVGRARCRSRFRPGCRSRRRPARPGSRGSRGPGVEGVDFRRPRESRGLERRTVCWRARASAVEGATNHKGSYARPDSSAPRGSSRCRGHGFRASPAAVIRTKVAILLHLGDRAVAGIAHRRAQPADQLMDDVADRPLVRHPALDPLGHELQGAR